MAGSHNRPPYSVIHSTISGARSALGRFSAHYPSYVFGEVTLVNQFERIAHVLQLWKKQVTLVLCACGLIPRKQGVIRSLSRPAS
jgi:hypothetical protein